MFQKPLVCLNFNTKGGGGLIYFIQMSKSKYQHFYPYAFLKKLRLKKGLFLGPFFLKKQIIWLVGFVALRPRSTAMVIAGRSVHLTTLFPGQARASG